MIATEIGFAGFLKQNNINCKINVIKVIVILTNIIGGDKQALVHKNFRNFLAEKDDYIFRLVISLRFSFS